MNKLLLSGVLVFVLIALAGCTPGPNEMESSPRDEGESAGFWQGLWHGIIAPITFVISLFEHSVGMYETHNNGGWYNFGFLLGLVSVWGGGSGGAAKAQCAREKKRKEHG